MDYGLSPTPISSKLGWHDLVKYPSWNKWICIKCGLEVIYNCELKVKD